MPVLEIPAELTRELRRAAVDMYSCALDRAHGPTIDHLHNAEGADRSSWETARVAVRDAERTLSLIGDDLTTSERLELTLADDDCVLMALLIEAATRLATAPLGMDPEPDDVVRAGATIEKLRALRTEDPLAVAA